ncbi:MAG: hypothetical protein ABI683_04370 [Ginsengibacter sp.]
MQDFRQKLYDYEANPPKQVWDNILNQMNSAEKKVIPISSFRKRSKFLFYGLTAAASLIIIFVSTLFFEKKHSGQNDQQTVSTPAGNNVNNAISDSINNKTLKLIIESSKEGSLAQNNPADSREKKYLTIAGPEGQPIKISSKVATLIVSADNDYPPKPVWDKKINKWKEIMLSSTISPTATNLLDIVQLSSIRADN